MSIASAARLVLLAPLLALAACKGGIPGIPGDSSDHRPFAEIAAGDIVHFSGTEPFWAGQVEGTALTFKTPDNPGGTIVKVGRFAGRGGLSFSGSLDGADLLIVFTPGQCADGMTDRTYPYVATLQLGPDTRLGCAWTDAHPYVEGPIATDGGAAGSGS